MKVDDNENTGYNSSAKQFLFVPLLTVFYVLLILVIDFLASSQLMFPFDWSWFSWSLADVLRHIPPLSDQVSILAPADHFDLFKFVFWFLLPFLFSYQKLDKDWIMPGKFQRKDWYFTAFLFLTGFIVLAALLLTPSLRHYYGQKEWVGASAKFQRAVRFLIWETSWLPGWEFLCRYVFLRALLQIRPRYLWLLLPVVEGLFHLQKPLIEALGMTVFSLFLTGWTVRRKNLFLPFCAHLFVEVLLLVVLLI
ncbi:MAG: CPBP family intramembrane metalloprotease [Candidatus Hydrogenedens sp.]|jgi:hypothetical protein|nr:CPBP family intramembrane metalloprotease [Candidatus Hydrogenedens sp.]